MRGTVLDLLGGGEQVLLTPFYSFVTVSLGKFPGSDALESVPLFPTLKEADPNEPRDPADTRVVQQTNTLMSLINAHESLNVASKTSIVWLGEGLGSIPKRVHERMLRWEFMDMADLRPRSSAEPALAETDTEKLVILPGFEVSQLWKKPVNNFITWVQCFCHYTTAMLKHYPDCTAGFLSHLLIVLKAFSEVEYPAWQEYDEAYREKMASTGNKTWTGMDVALYQGLCGSRQKLRTPQTERKEPPKGAGVKHPASGRGNVCRKFPHVCKLCRGNHPKRFCSRRGDADMAKSVGR